MYFVSLTYTTVLEYRCIEGIWFSINWIMEYSSLTLSSMYSVILGLEGQTLNDLC